MNINENVSIYKNINVNKNASVDANKSRWEHEHSQEDKYRW